MTITLKWELFISKLAIRLTFFYILTEKPCELLLDGKLVNSPSMLNIQSLNFRPLNQSFLILSLSLYFLRSKSKKTADLSNRGFFYTIDVY
jgi:hypothetical protein